MDCDWTKEKFQWHPGSTRPMTLTDLEYYQTSWNWLMPVVEKINKSDGKRKISISPYWVGTTLGDDDLFFDEDKETPIQQTYFAVIEFIKDFNSTQKEPV